MPRRDQLEKMLQAEPGDVFLNFALAMELLKNGETDTALHQFDRVIELDRNYVAAYFQKAQLLSELGRTADARAVLESGLHAARNVGDSHAEMELGDFLAQLDE
ncbi:MAG: tetratricopeptide repeat protein [Phycisphaerae bacterium]|nr:tetratricopeptide repeat protein [Phycisphaerae bacterium]